MPLPGPYKHKSGNKKRKGKKEEAEKIAKLPQLDSFLVKSQVLAAIQQMHHYAGNFSRRDSLAR